MIYFYRADPPNINMNFGSFCILMIILLKIFRALTSDFKCYMYNVDEYYMDIMMRMIIINVLKQCNGKIII